MSLLVCYLKNRPLLILASVWLRDTSNLLGNIDTTKRYYHGFDISPDQFPRERGDIEFSVHDITAPFPKEHWNRYDLVHVRLLVAAIDENDYKVAITNIHRILSKPFGSIILCILILHGR